MLKVKHEIVTFKIYDSLNQECLSRLKTAIRVFLLGLFPYSLFLSTQYISKVVPTPEGDKLR